ncbi:hypothetical protein H8K33_14550 [Undibacterium amnicola]|uniref:Cytochrome C n=1 Tax=Undibacterium amnicola TaxID=1834038 RepID=A0ABR6XTD9_9BURK|nr:hypothetical protein [Undibacterium amnicola]MBC3832726.1 hypothetical protein [Undibacterium amnicola]
MRKVLVCFVVVSSLFAGVCFADGDLDMDLMQNIEDLNKSLSSNLSLKDAKASTADAKELNRLFITVEEHFIKRGDAQNAVDLSKKSKDLTVEILTAVSANKFDAATDSATNLSRTCRTCHTFYKKE